MKKQSYDVDVVILSWNRAYSTIETISNLLEQKEVSVNLWVIDQGSQPEQINQIESYVNQFSNVHLIKLGKNLGVPGGRNLGMKMGNSDFIICIDNDAIFESNLAIKMTIEKFYENRDVSIIGYKINKYGSSTLDYSSWAYAKTLITKNNEEFFTTRYCGAGHAIRRSILEKTDFYDESLFFYWEELDLSYQVINQGQKILYSPDIVVLHKILNESRVAWEGKRFYFLVRNALILNWKYYRSIPEFCILSIGYLIKGMINKSILNSTRGIMDSISLIGKNQYAKKFKLNTNARKYIYENDTKYRGNIWKRLRLEIFSKLN